MTLADEQLEGRMTRMLGDLVGVMLDLPELSGEARFAAKAKALDALEVAIGQLKRNHVGNLALIDSMNGGPAPEGMV